MGKGFQNLELSVLRGLDRNKASGDDPDGVPLATAAYNLAPDRRGALVPYGRNAQHVVDASPVTVDGTLIGADERGFSSFDDGVDSYKLFDGDREVQGVLGYAPATVADSAHIHNFGAYRSRTQFLGYDDAADRKRVEPFSLRPTFVAEDGGALTEVSYGASPFIAVAVDPENDRWMAVTETGNVWVANGSDAPFTQVTSLGMNTVRTLAFGDGVWVVGSSFRVRYSTDFGATWTSPASGAGNIYKVVWTGSRFNAVREVAAGESEIIKSTDGVTWTQAGSLQKPLIPFGSFAPEDVRGAIAFSGSGFGLAISASNRGTSTYARVPFFSENGGDTWEYAGGSTYWIPSSPMLGLAGGPGDAFWAVNDFGAIFYLPNGRTPGVNTVAWDPAGNTSRHAKTVHYDFTRNKWYAVMADGSFWESENGTSLRAVSQLSMDAPPTVGALAPQLVASSEDAVIVVGNVGGAGGVRITGGTFGLESGTHRVYWVTSVSTNAGLVVIDIGSQEFAFENQFGAFVNLSIPSIAEIIAGMAWVNPGVPAEVTEAEDLLRERTFVDIYTSYSDVTPGDVAEAETQDPLVDIVPVFAFSLRPKDVADPARAVPNNPVGRILGSGDAVMTMGLQAGSAIVHNDRVWAVASNDETLYTTPNDGRSEPEAASVRGATVLVYSDIGYVNLMRQGSYITVLPSEGGTFVGMVSTPSGILAFFQNEVYLVSGDPASGNLGIELYPDMIGADPGTRPTRVGGMAFCIWKGDVYALAGGQAQPLSKPAFIREDPFVEVAAEPAARSLVCRTESGKVFRYFIEYQQWFENTLQTFAFMLPNPSPLGIRYVLANDDVYVIQKDGEPETPYLTYRNIDYGDKNRVDATYGMMVPTVGTFDDLNLPRLYFKILETHADVENGASTDYVDAHRQEGMFRFYIPRGNKARMWDFRLLLRGMEYGDTIEPQVVIEWVPGHRAIRRAS